MNLLTKAGGDCNELLNLLFVHFASFRDCHLYKDEMGKKRKLN